MTDGQTVVGGRYELRGLLGRGGMAEVYEGFDLRLGRAVAVKQLSATLAADPTAQARFGREARAAASLNHPNIASVFDTGEDTDPETGASIPYIVMELVEGSTLRAVLDEGAPLPPERAFSIIQSVLDALATSHAAGIIHRDIKPANVMITPTGVAKVMDFGIARAVDETSTSLTQTAAVIGTAHYLSPEQASGTSVDQRTDLYSTGCLLFELLTGRAPFVGETSISVAYQHVREDPIPPSQLNPGLSPAVDAVVLKSLAKDPDERYQSAEEMKADVALLGGDADPTRVRSAQPGLPAAAAVPVAAAALPGTTATEAVVAPPVVAPPPGTDPAGEEPRRGSPGRTILITVSVLLLLGLGAFGLYQLFGPGQSVVVPDVVGSTPAEADAELKKADLIPRFENVSGKAGDTVGTVVKQTPKEGASVAARSIVTLEVNVGPATAKIPDNLVGKDIQDVKKELKASGFTSVKPQPVRDGTGRAEPGEVLSIDPEEGASVALDEDIVIRYARSGSDASESTKPSAETSKTPDPEPTPSATEPTKTENPTDKPEPSASTKPSESPEPSKSAKSSGSPKGKLPKPSKTPNGPEVP